MLKLEPYSFSGILYPPTSKSFFQRALLLASFAKYPSVFHDVSWCADSLAMKSCLIQLGAKFSEEEKVLSVYPLEELPSNHVTLNVGESGLAARMLSTFLSAHMNNFTITGEGSLLLRSMRTISDALNAAGVSHDCKENKLPITIHSTYNHGNFHVDGSLSSQAITGLLMGLSSIQGKSMVLVDSMRSTPYLDITCEVLRLFGAKIKRTENRFEIDGDKLLYVNTRLEGDWSGVANFVIGATIKGALEIKGMRIDSYQADSVIVKLIQSAGGKIHLNADGTISVKQSSIKGFDFDVTNCPDLFPPLVLLACHSRKECKIEGISRLANKESDRLKNTLAMLVSFGVSFHVDSDALTIKNDFLWKQSIQTSSSNDHRMAMLASLIPLMTNNWVEIEGETCVNKSYPHYFEDLAKISKT